MVGFARYAASVRGGVLVGEGAPRRRCLLRGMGSGSHDVVGPFRQRVRRISQEAEGDCPPDSPETPAGQEARRNPRRGLRLVFGKSSDSGILPTDMWGVVYRPLGGRSPGGPRRRRLRCLLPAEAEGGLGYVAQRPRGCRANQSRRIDGRLLVRFRLGTRTVIEQTAGGRGRSARVSRHAWSVTGPRGARCPSEVRWRGDGLHLGRRKADVHRRGKHRRICQALAGPRLPPLHSR